MSISKTSHTAGMAAGSFFCLLMSIYVLKALRDEMALLSGLSHLGQLFTGSFLLLGLLALGLSLFYRPVVGQWILTILTTVILACWPLFYKQIFWFTPLAFMLLSCAGLLLIAQFWTAMLTRYNRYWAQQLYPFILFWGGLGVLAGPLLVMLLADMGPLLLSLTACFFLFSSSILLTFIKSPADGGHLSVPEPENKAKPMRIGAMIMIYSILGTLLYARQLELLNEAALEQAARIHFFGLRDLGIGIFTLLIQWLNYKYKNTGMQWLGLQWMPIITWGLLLTLGFAGSLETVLWSMVIFRSVNYACVRPARESYYQGMSKAARFKGFIDTLSYRTGDLLGIWLYQWWSLQELSHTTLAISLLPLILIWYYINQKIAKSLKLQHE